MYNLKETKEIVSLSYAEIFNSIGELNIYFKYLGYYPDTRNKFRSPFTRDSSPSFSFRMYEKLNFKCFSTGKSGDAIALVSHLFNESYADAAKRISRDFQLSGGTLQKRNIQTSSLYSKYDTEIQVVIQDFSEKDLAYWNQARITKDILDFYDIKVVERVWVDKGNGWYIPKGWTYTSDNPIFRYKINGRYKCYRPLEPNPESKWISNTKAKDIQGYDQLPKTGKNLVITKSMKDVLCWKVLGIPAIAQCSESQPLTDDFFQHFYSRFDNLYINFDFDKAGLLQAEKYSLPKIFTGYYKYKDPFDLIKGLGFEPARDILTNQIVTL